MVAAKYSELDEFIDSLPSQKGALISVLHKAQELYGYLPAELQKHIAMRLKVPSAKVYGVVTFYTFLKMEHPGRHPVSVCMGTACFVRGSEAVQNEFEKELRLKSGNATEDGLFSLESVRCVGACGLAPVVRVGERVFGRVRPEDVRGIVEEYMVREELDNG